MILKASETEVNPGNEMATKRISRSCPIEFDAAIAEKDHLLDRNLTGHDPPYASVVGRSFISFLQGFDQSQISFHLKMLETQMARLQMANFKDRNNSFMMENLYCLLAIQKAYLFDLSSSYLSVVTIQSLGPPQRINFVAGFVPKYFHPSFDSATAVAVNIFAATAVDE